MKLYEMTASELSGQLKEKKISARELTEAVFARIDETESDLANESARPLANLTICGQRSGRECIFTANASVCSAKNARNDVHAVISDESLVLPRLCQYSERALF